MSPANPALDASGRGSAGAYRVGFPARMLKYTDEEIEAVVRVLRDGATLTQGECQARFEADFAHFLGVEHVFAVSNDTAALKLAAVLSGVGPGDEVIIPAYTFCATAIPFASTGAKVVWADIDPRYRTISPSDVERKITRRTKVIVGVHILGVPCEIEALLQIARPRGIQVVEDCAQAPGARYRGRSVGSFGDYGCFSFQGAKNFTTMGEGGLLMVKDPKRAALVPGLRHNGVRGFAGPRARYWVPAMGDVDIDMPGVWPHKFCMTEAQCALGSALLPRLDQINDDLRAQAAALQERLKGSKYLRFQQVPEGGQWAAHTFVVSLDEAALGASRDQFMDIMTAEFGIRLIVQYYPLYKYPLFVKMGLGESDCPNLEKFWPTSYSYPWWHGVPPDTLDYLAECTLETLHRLKSAVHAGGR